MSPKKKLFEQFARVAKSLASPNRLELLETLAQGEKSVDALAQATGMSVANTSHHLQILRDSGLAESRKEGLQVIYRLSDDQIPTLMGCISRIAEKHLAEVERMAARHATAAQATQEAVMAPVRAVLERLRADREKESTEFLDALTSGSPAAAMELALASAGRLPALQAAERLARGEPTEIIRSASVVVEARSVEDLAKTVEALAVAGVLSLPLPDLEVIESQEVETA